MKESFYAAERDFLEKYLKEKALAPLGDFKAASDLWGKPMPGPGTDAAVDEIYGMDGDAAHIKIEGPLSPEGPDAWDRFWGYGGASYMTIRAAMERAKNDPAVRKVIFDVNSPGGTLAGCDETWQAHKALAAAKPTEVHAVNLLASAAYEIAAPAGKILASGPSTRIGSIGVLVATYDWSKWEENVGIKEVIVTSGNAPDKHPDVSTKRGRDTIKAQLDALERVFYAHISESRGVTAEHIAEHFGRGGVLVAQDPSAEHEDAIRSGMIDGLTTDGITASNAEDADAPQARSIDPEKEKQAQVIIDNMTLTSEQVSKKVEQCINNSSYEGKNTPATAGKKQEGQTMELSEYLKANPAAEAEIEKLKREAKAAGAQEAKAEYSARVDRVLPVIQSGAYPANIKTIACNVLAGKSEIAEFTASVAVYDNVKESGKSASAQAETAELGGVTAEAPDGKSAADREIDAALQAEIDKRKVKR